MRSSNSRGLTVLHGSCPQRSAMSAWALRVALCLSLPALLPAGWSATTAAQQVTVETPLIGVQDGFHEHFGVGGGFHWRHPSGMAFFHRGWGPPWAPGFGPGGGFGFGVRGGGGGFGFGIHGASGSHRSLTMSAPSVTVPNGGIGFVQDVTISPFVTGLIPVVGYSLTSPLADRVARLNAGELHAREISAGGGTAAGGPAAGGRSPHTDAGTPSPRAAASTRVRSSAEQGDISVAQIRQQQQIEDAARREELALLITQAHEALEAGRRGAARVRFQQAAARAEGAQKQELLRQIELLAAE